MSSVIRDVWFRSPLPLAEIARRLEVRYLTADAENYWTWVLGFLGHVQIDITRTHILTASQTDTRIFVPGAPEFPAGPLAEVVSRLRQFVPGPVKVGRWEHRSGNDFNLVVVREYRSDDSVDVDKG
jgi:hypothetical protein